MRMDIFMIIIYIKIIYKMKNNMNILRMEILEENLKKEHDLFLLIPIELSKWIKQNIMKVEPLKKNKKIAINKAITKSFNTLKTDKFLIVFSIKMDKNIVNNFIIMRKGNL